MSSLAEDVYVTVLYDTHCVLYCLTVLLHKIIPDWLTTYGPNSWIEYHFYEVTPIKDITCEMFIHIAQRESHILRCNTVLQTLFNNRHIISSVTVIRVP
jgi:hypothetical protein